MTYRLKFLPEALAEWQALDGSVKETLRMLLKKRLAQPNVPSSELRGDLNGCYKIKLLKQGYRLVYTVADKEWVVLVVAIDRVRTWPPIAPPCAGSLEVDGMASMKSG